MSKFLQLEVAAAQIREAKTSEEEVLFHRFIKVKASNSLYKSKKPWFISKELSLKLSFLRQILGNPSRYTQ